jgi:porin
MKVFWFLVLVISVSTGLAYTENENVDQSIWDRDVLAGDLMGLRKYLSDDVIQIDLGLTQIYQNNFHGGLSTDSRRGRYSGSYDIEIGIDAEKLFGIEGSSFYILTEGNWTDTAGIDGASVGSVFGVNGDAAGDRSMDVTELWYEHSLHDDSDVILRFGKLDLTGGFECRGCPVAFDGSLYANDETSQFTNNALVNNPTIPFPENGIGAILYFSPADSGVYLSAGISDAQADARETGFSTAFGDEDYFFSIVETGFTSYLRTDNGSLPGIYRVGFWYDPQPKGNSDSTKMYRDDMGFYVSCDQGLVKENDEAEDSQGLGMFFRYGYAPSRTNDVSNFVSGGVQYQGLFDGRDDDVLGVGVAYGKLSDGATTTYMEDYESVVEIYYNAQVMPWCNVTPSLQYVGNPGAASGVSDTVIFGARVQMVF